MKIGDTPPFVPPGGSATEAVEGGGKTAKGAGFATQLEGTAQPHGAGPGSPAPVGDLPALAADVDSGRMSASEAVQRLVDQVLATQIPGDASQELRARVRAVIEATLESDPLLSGLVKRLGARA